MKTSFKLAHCCVLVVFLLALLTAGYPSILAVKPAANAFSPSSSTHAELAALPEAFRAAASTAIGADDPSYAVTAVGMQYQAAKPRQGLAALIGPQGFVVRRATADWGLRLAAWGRGKGLRELAAGVSTARANRVAVDRGGIVEWWVNGPLGLEQGWTVAQPAQGPGVGSLTLRLTQSGSLCAIPGSDAQTLALVDSTGHEVLRYAGLAAADARGRALPAHFELAGEVLSVVVDDAQAVYPIRIDPWLQSALLTAGDGAGNDNLGKSVAISADGSTVVVGAPNRTVNKGVLYVFTRPAGGWANEASTVKLTVSDSAAADYLGSSVAISGDGSTIVAGTASKAVVANLDQGQVFVFVKPSSGGWVSATQKARLTALDGVAYDRLGGSVAVNSDGTTVVAGASSKNGGKGQVYVFVKPASGGWVDGTEKAWLTALDGVAGDGLGHSVAVSGDGATIAAGSWWANGSQGAVYVFVKPAGAWATATQKAKLTNSDFNSSGTDLLGS